MAQEVWVEGVTEPDRVYLSNFEQLVDDEGLRNFSGFTRPIETFDEPPLYSRISQLAFLGDLDARERAEQLIRAAVWHLRRLVDYIEEARFDTKPDFLCMLSIVDWEQLDDDGMITPAFWYTHRRREMLELIPLASPESWRACFVLEVLNGDETLTVHDSPGDPMDRVYVQYEPRR